MNKDIQKARRLISAVRLANVRLVEAVAKTRVRLEEVTEDMAPFFRHSAKGCLAPESGVFYVLARLEVRLCSEGSNVEHASMKVQFELEYRVPSDFELTPAEVSAFARVNGVFNAWPYFREFVQSTSQKMDLPVIILPVYRVPQPPRRSTEQSQQIVADTPRPAPADAVTAKPPESRTLPKRRGGGKREIVDVFK